MKEYHADEENLHESDIDENGIKEIELEEEYLDFPDPIEYLIGFFATKSDPIYTSSKVSVPYSKSITMTASPKKKPPVVQNNYLEDTQPKALYQSHYNCQKPQKPDHDLYVVHNKNSETDTSNYQQRAFLSNSYDKPNMFFKSKYSVGDPMKYSKTIDEDDRLCRTLGEDQMYDMNHESSIERSSVGHPSFDPYASSRSYTYDPSSITKDTGSYLNNHIYQVSNNNSSVNSYRQVKKTLGYDSPADMQPKIYTEEHILDKDKTPRENEIDYAGGIAAGTGSVSSTKIKKELESKKRKFKKIEYNNSRFNTDKTAIEGVKKNNYVQYQRKYKFKPAGLMNSSRGGTTTSKPPLSTIKGPITSGVTTYKYSKSRAPGDSLLSGRENSTGSYRSIEDSGDSARKHSYVKSYMRETKNSVASKLSATLPKSSGYKKVSSSSNYKSSMYHKKQSSGNKIQIYSNSHRESSKNSGSSLLKSAHMKPVSKHLSNSIGYDEPKTAMYT